MSTLKRFFALCLALLLLLAPLACLLRYTHALDSDLDMVLEQLEDLRTQLDSLDTDYVALVVVLNDSTTPTTQPEETHPTEQEQTQATEHPTVPHTHPTDPTQTQHQVDTKPANYYGRLCIPGAGIDVGLYYGADQAICDRQDSANIFSMSVFDGLYIADHNTQEFGKLSNVTVGMQGYLQLPDGTSFNIVCTDVLNGHNTGKYIVDENGNANLDADYLMYTCRNGAQNILICLWKHR